MAKDSWSEEELEHFKEIILEKRKQVIDEINSLEKAVQGETNSLGEDRHSYHMADMGTNAQEREKEYMLIDREKKYLGHLNSALKRLKNGDYGRCIECGELIPEERLEEVPHTRHCAECKS